MKKRWNVGLMLLLTVALLPLGACANKGFKPSARAKALFSGGDADYLNVEARYKLNYAEMLYDDFSNGIDTDVWDIADNVWEQYQSFQNGVRPENLILLNDPAEPESHLLVRATGDYYAGETVAGVEKSRFQNAGGVISTQRAWGPGRFETRMRLNPRVGALTTMWVFAWKNVDDSTIIQSEVDIEMGLRPGFDKAYFTTWTSPANNTSLPINIAPINDGKFHTYSFDWSVEGEKKVDYYIDGTKVQTITANIPNYNATLSIGTWCPTFAGINTNPNEKDGGGRLFGHDYAHISWVRVIPFEQDGWVEAPVKNANINNRYPVPTLTKLPVVNMLSDSDFSTEIPSITLAPNAQSYLPKPWSFLTTDGTADENKSRVIEEPDGNKALFVADNGYGRQLVLGAYAGYRYRLKGRYRTENNTKAAVRMSGHNNVYITSINDTSFDLTEELPAAPDWTTFSCEFTVTDDTTQTLVLWLFSSGLSGTSYFDDIELNFLGKV